MASAAELPSYTLLHLPTDQETPSEQQLKADLEKGDPRTKAEALKKVIFMITNGEKIPGILMTIIRFVLPSQDHTIKKLLKKSSVSSGVSSLSHSLATLRSL